MVLLAVTVGTTLLLLFPHIDFTAPDLAGKPDELTADYLRVLLRSKPRDRGLRLILGRQQLELGHYSRCRATLAPLREGRDATAVQARMLYLAATKALYHKDPGSETGKRMRASARVQIALLLEDPLGTAELKKLTRVSLELGLDRFTGALYDRLGTTEPRRRSKWYATAGRWYLAAGRYGEAARAYMRASTVSRSHGEALAHARAAVEAWTAGARPERALALCRKQVTRFPGDDALLKRVVTLALAVGQQAVALEYNGRLLKRHPGNRHYMERQIQLARGAGQNQLALRLNTALLSRKPRSKRLTRRQVALTLALGHNEQAYQLARKLLEMDPEDRASRLEVARLARWTGRPEVALSTFRWLAARGHRRSHADALALARELSRPGVVIQLIRQAERRRGLVRAEVQELARALEATGEPAPAAAALEAYLSRKPKDTKLRVALADLRQRLGQHEAALAASEAVTRDAGPVREEVIRQAQLLWMMGRAREAMKRLRAHAPRVAASDRQFWAMMGALAWDLGASKDTHRAYRPIVGVGSPAAPEEEAAERFVHAAIRQGHLLEALGVAARMLRHRGKSGLLLDTLKAMSAAGRWEELRAALARLRLEVQLQGDGEYWLVQAALARHDGELWRAGEALRRALRIMPASRDVRLAWLWLLVDTGAEEELRGALRRYSDAAHRDPAYWPAYASGRALLGQPLLALRFRRWLAQRHPLEIRHVAAYADVLEQVGRRTRAWRLRQYIARDLQQRAHKTLARFVKGAKGAAAARKLTPRMEQMRDTLLAFGGVIWRERGSSLARRWLHPVLHYASFDPTVQRYAVAWNLARNNLRKARGWMRLQRQSGHPPTAQQELTVAMAGRDGGALSSLLGAADSGLTVVDRVHALTRLGRRREALRLARSAAAKEAVRTGAEAAALGRSVLALEDAVGSWARADAQWLAVGSLDALSLKIASRVRFGDLAVEGSALHRSLLTSPTGGLTGGSFERWRLRLGGAMEGRAWDARLGLGVLITGEGQHRFSPGFLLSLRPWAGALLQLEGIYAGDADESAAMMLFGLRSRALTRLRVDVTRRLLSEMSVSWGHFTDLDGGAIGHGVGAEGAVAYALSLMNPALRMRLGASGGYNWLQPDLPAGIAGKLAPASPMDLVLPQKFFTAGIGATISQLLFGGWNRPGPRLAGELDGWLGYWWPDHRLTFRLTAGLSWRLFARHRLIANFSYGNQQGVTAGQHNAGVGLKYEYRIAQ